MGKPRERVSSKERKVKGNLFQPLATCFTGRLPQDTRPFSRLIGGIISPFVCIECAPGFHHRACAAAPVSSRTVKHLVLQQQQAQRDLEQLYNVCGTDDNRADWGIQCIEQTYSQLVGTLEYVYERVKANVRASSIWMQTELMQVANAAQRFTNNVWAAILQRDQEQANEDVNRDTHILRVKDAIQFLQVASQQ